MALVDRSCRGGGASGVEDDRSRPAVRKRRQHGVLKGTQPEVMCHLMPRERIIP